MKRVVLSILLLFAFLTGYAQNRSASICRLGFTYDISQSNNWGKFKPVITGVIPYSSAELAGVKQGDIVEAIDGVQSAEVSPQEIAQLLNPAGKNEVILTVSNLSIPTKQVMVKKDCKKVNSITEDQLASAFSMYSLETTSERTFTCPFKTVVTPDSISFGKFKTFDDVTLTHIYEFDMFIREEETYTSTGKLIERSQAAIHNYHKRFKSYVSEAFRLGLIKENPYNRFQDKRGEKGKRPHLTKDQIKRLIAIREESADRVANKYLDFFLFQIFTGMAYSDAKSFDYTQHIITVDGHDYIDGHRMKTGEEFITPILPYTQKILERNDYKLHITSNQKYNQFLKGVGLALGCSFPLTTHVARHTFACTISLGEGIPKEVLQVMMGHSSIRTTELYAKLPMEFVTRNLDKKLFHVWG